MCLINQRRDRERVATPTTISVAATQPLREDAKFAVGADICRDFAKPLHRDRADRRQQAAITCARD